MVMWAGLVQQYPWLENQYASALILLVITVLIAKVFQLIIIQFFKQLTKKTETDLDDIIIRIASRPIFYLIFVVGLWFSSRILTVLNPYRSIVNGSFFVIGVVILSWMISRIVALITTRWFMAHRGLDGSPRLLNMIASVVIYIGAFIIILSYFNIEITPLVAALGVGGLAVGLALQDTLGNVFAGIHIISDQPVRVNDIIEVVSENITGRVEDIGWRSTRIQTFLGNTVIVPNARLANSVITNYQMPEQSMKAVIECGVDYTSDLAKVEKVTLSVANEVQKKVDGAITDFEPIFRFHTFADSNVNFRVILGAKSRGEKFVVEHEFIKRLHKRFEREGIEISWPIQKIYHMSPLELKNKARKK